MGSYCNAITKLRNCYEKGIYFLEGHVGFLKKYNLKSVSIEKGFLLFELNIEKKRKPFVTILHNDNSEVQHRLFNLNKNRSSAKNESTEVKCFFF